MNFERRSLTVVLLAACLAASFGCKSERDGSTDCRSAMEAAIASSEIQCVSALLMDDQCKAHRIDLEPLLLSDKVLFNPEMLELLIQAGFNANYTEEMLGMTPLLLAASYGQADSVTKLIELGANPRAKNKLGQGLVWEAVAAKSIDILDLAVSLGVSLDEPVRPRMRTPLDLAISLNDGRAISVLAEAGADICGTDAEGQSRVEMVRSFDQNLANSLEANCPERGPGSEV